MRYRTIVLILMMSIWLGCSSDEMGTLELKINNPKDSPITQARVRVDGKDKASLNLSVESHFIDLDAGEI